jgi:hypothetical protein
VPELEAWKKEMYVLSLTGMEMRDITPEHYVHSNSSIHPEAHSCELRVNNSPTTPRLWEYMHGTNNPEAPPESRNSLGGQ